MSQNSKSWDVTAVAEGLQTVPKDRQQLQQVLPTTHFSAMQVYRLQQTSLRILQDWVCCSLYACIADKCMVGSTCYSCWHSCLFYRSAGSSVLACSCHFLPNDLQSQTAGIRQMVHFLLGTISLRPGTHMSNTNRVLIMHCHQSRIRRMHSAHMQHGMPA